MQSSIRITGVEEAVSKLRSIAPNLRMKVLKNALMRGAEIYGEEAGRRVPKKTKRLEQSIRPRRRVESFWSEVVWSVAIRGKGKGGFMAFHIEKGHVMKSRQGYVIGYYPPHPFMRPAFDTKSPEVIEMVKTRIIEALNKIK